MDIVSRINIGFDISFDPLMIQVIKHRDIVMGLNKFLKEIENADNELFDRPLGHGLLLWGLLRDLLENEYIKFEEKNEETFPLDDPQKGKKIRIPGLTTKNCDKAKKVKFKVYTGGLCPKGLVGEG